MCKVTVAARYVLFMPGCSFQKNVLTANYARGGGVYLKSSSTEISFVGFDGVCNIRAPRIKLRARLNTCALVQSHESEARTQTYTLIQAHSTQRTLKVHTKHLQSSQIALTSTPINHTRLNHYYREIQPRLRVYKQLALCC